MSPQTSSLSTPLTLPSPLCGTWRLTSLELIYEDGRNEPYSRQRVDGFLYYSGEGRMAVSIFEVDTGKMVTSYSGPYHADGKVVAHTPQLGWSPYGLNDKKRREFTIKDHTLTLDTEWLSGPTPRQKTRMRWLLVEGNGLK